MTNQNLKKAVLLGCLFTFISFACNVPDQKSNAITQPSKADQIIAQSISTHGGLDTWKNIGRIQYIKEFSLYDSLGNEESSTKQKHLYQYGSDPLVHISWSANDQLHDLYERHDYYSKMIDGKPDTTSSSDQLRNTVLSSTYVYGIPFKLLDPGPAISFAGTEKIWTGEMCNVLKVVYDPQSASNLSTADTWWYYFSQDDARVRAAKVKHLDHISGIRNISYREVDGFLFNHERESYRLDDNGNELYLRAKYIYDDYEVTMRQ